ncbi:MAG: NADPH-dependent FMN reductase [Christensenellales bacterium]
MSKTIDIIGFTGSLREKSYNMAALRAAKDLLPEDVSLEILDLSELPFYNQDLDREGPVDVVVAFKERIDKADGILISTPEYNYSLPPVLKNALDWASRGSFRPLDGKPLAIMSVSQGLFGGARAQYHLRQVCVGLNLQILNKPEVFVAGAGGKFDSEGNLTDQSTGNFIKRLLEALAAKIRENRLLEEAAAQE